MLGSILQDLRYAVRTLAKNPGFTAVAVVTLALGVGTNAAIFSLIDGVMLKPLAFREPDRLVALYHRELDGSSLRDAVTPGNFYDWQAGVGELESMAAYSTQQLTLTGRGEPQRLDGVLSAGSLFDVLGVPARYGRALTSAEDNDAAPRVAVLSHALWQRLFNAGPGAIGQALVLNGRPYTVVGVMPPSFRFPDGHTELWVPAAFEPELRASRTEYMLDVIGRLKPGASIESARAQLETVMARLRVDHPQANETVGGSIFPLKGEYVTSVQTRLLVLMAAVGAVLLIACANLANLLLSRASVRQREVAVRQALGASRPRIVRQLLTESIVLAVVGGGVGLLIGSAFLQVLLSLMGPQLPRLEDIAIDRNVFAFTFGVSLVAGILFGLAPALQLSDRGPGEALREGSRGTSRGGGLRAALVVSEVALAMVLLAASGLLVRSFVALQRVDPGFRTDRILTFRVELPGAPVTTRTQRVGFFRTAVERLSSLPGVVSAAAASNVPLSGPGPGAWFNMLDRPVGPGQTPPSVSYRVVSSGYLETMGIPLRRGRTLTDGDGADGSPSVVISEALARRYYQDRDPIGREIYLGAPDNKLFEHATIVGIVGDVTLVSLDDRDVSVVYAPHALMTFWQGFRFVIRTAADPASAASAAQQEIRSLNPDVPIVLLSTLKAVAAESIAPQRASMLLMGLFSAIALTMAAVGVFGVLSYSVSQRTRELGIRMALGAEPASVRRMVIREGLVQSSIGVVIGIVVAALVTRLMSSILFGVSPIDPLTFTAVALLLMGISALASYVPARRATSVDPIVALRCE